MRMEKPDQRIVVFSFYRDAELHGARLLLNLHRHLTDSDSQIKLTRHLADETRHAALWTKRIFELGSAPTDLRDGYQRRLGLRIGVPKNPLELLALTIIAEERALDRYRSEAARPDLDPATREVLEAVTGDETWHLAWVREKLHEMASERGAQARADEILERYHAIEKDVYATFLADEAALLSA
jgi:bacterioferritin (cytochrome b1)